MFSLHSHERIKTVFNITTLSTQTDTSHYILFSIQTITHSTRSDVQPIRMCDLWQPHTFQLIIMSPVNAGAQADVVHTAGWLCWKALQRGANNKFAVCKGLGRRGFFIWQVQIIKRLPSITQQGATCHSIPHHFRQRTRKEDPSRHLFALYLLSFMSDREGYWQNERKMKVMDFRKRTEIHANFLRSDRKKKPLQEACLHVSTGRRVSS